MAQYIYTMNRVGKVVPPKRHILRDISLSFFPGAKIGVLGLNGSGKSTLLRIMAGTDTDIEGEARPQPGIKVGLLPQEPQLDPEADVRSIVEESAKPVKDALARLEQVYVLYSEPDADFDKLAAEQGKLEAFLASVDGHNLERQLDVAADALRLPPWDAKMSQLSGGERRRVALCRLLLSKPDMLLLDEPTNHLDAESVAWLEKYLEQYPSTVICVTHDRYFLDNVAGWILELDRGHGIPWQGNYSSWLEQKEQRLAQEEKQQEGLRRTLARELEWVRANPKARQAKSKARLRQFDELSSVEFQARNETNEIYIPPGPRLGDLVIEVEKLRKGYGERLLIDDLSFRLPPGGIVGIIGPNGAGKTTLFRMLSGAEKPDAGTIRTGPTVKIAYVDQSRDKLDDRKTVWQEISGGQDIIKVGNYETASRGYVGRFNFRGNQQQQQIGELSGGERNRVHLAKLLKSGANVLLLDEPTNDLDVETLRALEEALLNFPGLRRRHLARPLVPRPHRDSYPRLRGRQRGRLVRGQLPGVRGGPPPPQGRARRPAAPVALQAAARLRYAAWRSYIDSCGTTAPRPGKRARPPVPALPGARAHLAGLGARLQRDPAAQAGTGRPRLPLRVLQRAGLPALPVKLYAGSRVELSPNFVELERARERFNFTYLPEDTEALLKEAFACFTAACYNAFASMCRRVAQRTFADLGADGKLELYDELANIRKLAELDDESFEVVRKVLFDFDEPGRGNLPVIDAFQAGVLLEVLKDLLYQAYVRRGRLQQAMMVRRYFSDDSSNVTPLPGSRT